MEGRLLGHDPGLVVGGGSDLSMLIPGHIRYQLLHRTVLALLVAEQFSTKAAVMLVHSFSPTNKWFEDFAAFAALFSVQARIGSVQPVGIRRNLPLYIGWCSGDQGFRASSQSL